MALEVEAKFRLADPDAMRRALDAAGAEASETVLEHNTYYDRPDGSLRRADCGLRLRTAEGPDGAMRTTMTYKGPRRPGELKVRPEAEIALDDAAPAAELLAGLGLTTTLAFQKRRCDFRLGPAVVSLDELPELGFFLEIEAPDAAAVQAARNALGLADTPTVTDTYIALVAEHLGGRRTTLSF